MLRTMPILLALLSRTSFPNSLPGMLSSYSSASTLGMASLVVVVISTWLLALLLLFVGGFLQ
jgi:hypothetical protein